MALLNTKTFRQLVQQQAAAVQAYASGLIDLSVGSVLRAILQAVAAVGLWLQALVLRVLSLTRLATSVGEDADSWVADFGGPFVEGGVALFARLPAASSVGELTFARLSTTGTAVVPIGATVESADGSQRFVVTLDADSADYDADLGGYVLGVGDAEIDVPAASVNSGAAANALAGTVTVITSPIVGVDRVENADDFVGGADAESDAALRERFRSFLPSLREATPAALEYYIRAIQAGVDVRLVENEDPDGSPHVGSFYVIVDDGTGAPSVDFLNTVRTVVELHRAAGVLGSVFGPTPVVANIAVTMDDLADDADPDAVEALVATAVAAHISALGLGDDVVYNRLFQVVYDASPELLKASVTLNLGTADIVIADDEVAQLGTLAVTT